VAVLKYPDKSLAVANGDSSRINFPTNAAFSFSGISFGRKLL
jgi:hypothetical protein